MKSRQEIGKSLQTLRKEAGYKSAVVFAEHMNYNTGTYTNWEQGKQLFSIEQAWDMADALDCTIDALVGRDLAPPAVSTPALAPDEDEMVGRYRRMSTRDKAVAMGMVRSLSADPDAGAEALAA